jgi:hypothetical protein
VLRQNSGQAFHHGQALRQTDTKHEQEIMHLIDRLGAVSDQRFAQPMQLFLRAASRTPLSSIDAQLIRLSVRDVGGM